MLADKEWGSWSSRRIAEHIGCVSHTLVDTLRANRETDTSKRTGKDGRQQKRREPKNSTHHNPKKSKGVGKTEVAIPKVTSSTGATGKGCQSVAQTEEPTTPNGVPPEANGAASSVETEKSPTVHSDLGSSIAPVVETTGREASVSKEVDSVTSLYRAVREVGTKYKINPSNWVALVHFVSASNVSLGEVRRFISLAAQHSEICRQQDAGTGNARQLKAERKALSDSLNKMLNTQGIPTES